MNLRRLNLDNWSRNFLILAVALLIPQVALLYWSIPQLPPGVPLFYSLPWGESRLVSPELLWLIPAVVAGVFVLNLIGSHFLKELVLTRILSSTAALVSSLALLTLIKIVLLGLP